MSVMKRILSLHAQRYPLMEPWDYVKLLYQSEFGPGHLVEEGDVLPGLQAEFIMAKGIGYAPPYLSEAIGGGLCRFHLDPHRLSPEDLPLLARCFALSARPRGSMAGLWHKLGEFSALAHTGALPLDPEECDLILHIYEMMGCPPRRHTNGYREAYHPHYRVMDRDLGCFFPAFQAIDAALRANVEPVIVAVDGRCAAGKTSFAARCARLFEDCQVFHMDDFFLPPEKRTPQRLSEPGGNVDYERALTELFTPLSRGEAVALRRFECATGTYSAPRGIPCGRLNIIEGSYSLHPALADRSLVHIFLTCGPETQNARLIRREDPESLQRFRQQWIPLEEAYFAESSVESRCDVVIDTSRLPLSD